MDLVLSLQQLFWSQPNRPIKLFSTGTAPPTKNATTEHRKALEKACAQHLSVHSTSGPEALGVVLGRPTGVEGTRVDKKTQSNEGPVEIYTDGGCRGNPGPGAWAAIIYEGPKPREIYKAQKNTTNQRMELQAAIEGLKSLNEPSKVKLYSDSAYLLNAMSKGWVYQWEQKGWKKSNKKPVKNSELWKELLELSRVHEVEWVKVKGHAGHPANERCHALVQLAIARRL